MTLGARRALEEPRAGLAGGAPSGDAGDGGPELSVLVCRTSTLRLQNR